MRVTYNKCSVTSHEFYFVPECILDQICSVNKYFNAKDNLQAIFILISS